MLRSSTFAFASSQARNCQAHDPERMNGRSCWTAFRISTIIVSRTRWRTMNVRYSLPSLVLRPIRGSVSG